MPGRPRGWQKTAGHNAMHRFLGFPRRTRKRIQPWRRKTGFVADVKCGLLVPAFTFAKCSSSRATKAASPPIASIQTGHILRHHEAVLLRLPSTTPLPSSRQPPQSPQPATSARRRGCRSPTTAGFGPRIKYVSPVARSIGKLTRGFGIALHRRKLTKRRIRNRILKRRSSGTRDSRLDHRQGSNGGQTIGQTWTDAQFIAKSRWDLLRHAT